ncbi:MAG: OmpA family protein [Piscinibacter sp.]|uniref:OmpA family protein n=1 Tax=Piscinibacter TaxID=1114981 RepID=UPI000FDDDC6F|nr:MULTISPECIES: OmpA family protein [Piscinibacter]MCW5667873.1 OmpA family protein [Piscinibacter sp.]
MRHALRLPSLHAPAALLAAALLAACATPVAPPPNVPPPVAPAQPSSTAPAPQPVAPTGAWTWSPELDEAASRLRGSLRGSSVDVVQTTDQRLWLSLPAEDTFALGRSAIKPGAGAWLDEVARSLKGLPRAEVQIVAAPDAKGAGGSALALDRASSARDWMVMRGVPARRVTVSAQLPKSAKAPVSNRLEILIGERSGAPATR